MASGSHDAEIQSQLIDLIQALIQLKKTPNEIYEQILLLQEKCSRLSSLLLDVLVALEGDIETNEEEKTDAKKAFIQFLDLISDKVIPDEILRVELEILEASDASTKQQLVRLKTRLYFKQSKFNLIREESEGYAKLITELVDSGDDISAKSMMTRVLCLIGQFNLDPNRVTDIVLESFECCPNNKEMFIALIKEMKTNKDYLCTLLGFKFTFYHDIKKETPFSLYTVTARLLNESMIDLTKITAFMLPQAEGIKESHKSRSANAGIRAKKAETIMTANMSIPIDNNRTSNVDSYGVETNQNIVGVSFAAVAAIQDLEDSKIAEESDEEAVLASNQKLGLVCALLEEGSWILAKQLIDRLPEYYTVQASVRVCIAISRMIDRSIDDFYMKKCSRRLDGIDIERNSHESVDSSFEKVTNWSQLADLSSILWYIGPRIAYQPKTATKLLRLITVFYQEDRKADQPDISLSNSFMDIVDEVVLPAMCLSDSNVAYSEELWNLLQLFPYTSRYRLYGRWKSFHTSRHPEVNIARGKVLGRAKYVLKRLSKETVRVMGRQLGKLCHVHPIPVLEYLLSQIQTFDSLIQPVVESLKFLTNLEFDILTFCIIEQLASPDRQQLKSSDGTLSPWLQALATLVGAVFKKYNVEIQGMLNYVANQLKNQKSFDLLLLREIIQNMSSIESSAGATQEQIDALSGGELLKQEAGGFSTARNKRASTRLRDSILTSDLAVGMCILMAQQRDCIINQDSQQLPLKLVGEMLDQCRDTLLQFGSFLVTYVKTDEYCKRMPPAHILMSDYHVQLDCAMYLTRPMYLPKVISSYDAAKKAMKQTDGDTKTKLDSKQKFVFFKSAFDGLLDELIVDLDPVIPTCLRDSMPVRLIVTFWVLSSYDIEVPTTSYDRAIENIRNQIKEVVDSFDMSKSKRTKEEERLRGIEAKLKEEQKRQIDHVDRIKTWLSHSKDQLFEANRPHQTPAFLQLCILPRVLFSEGDAVYCARLIILLHQQRTTFFQSLILLDKAFNDILPFISGLTENEAASMGRFFQILLCQAHRWMADKAVFDKECEGFPGFLTKMKSVGDTEKTLNHDSYKKLVNKWQVKLHKGFLSVLSVENNDYIMLRNCLVIMTKMTPCFPILTDLCPVVENAVAKVRDWEKGKRDDLSLKAASYAGRLKMRNITTYTSEQLGVKPIKIVNGDATKDRKRVSTTVSDDAKKKLKVDSTSSASSSSDQKEVKAEKKEVKTEKTEKKEAKSEKKETKVEKKEIKTEPVEKIEKAEKNDKADKNDKVEKNDKTEKSTSREKAVKEERKEETVKEKRVEKKEPVEDGEVPPSPPAKKAREDKKEPTPKRSEKKEKKEREEKTNGKEKDDRRKDERKREKSCDEDLVGPMPPPEIKREARNDDRKEGKGVKRSNDESSRDVKLVRKDREGLERRLTRPTTPKERRESRESPIRDRKEKDRRPSSKSSSSRR